MWNIKVNNRNCWNCFCNYIKVASRRRDLISTSLLQAPSLTRYIWHERTYFSYLRRQVSLVCEGHVTSSITLVEVKQKGGLNVRHTSQVGSHYEIQFNRLMLRRRVRNFYVEELTNKFCSHCCQCCKFVYVLGCFFCFFLFVCFF